MFNAYRVANKKKIKRDSDTDSQISIETKSESDNKNGYYHVFDSNSEFYGGKYLQYGFNNENEFVHISYDQNRLKKMYQEQKLTEDYELPCTIDRINDENINLVWDDDQKQWFKFLDIIWGLKDNITEIQVEDINQIRKTSKTKENWFDDESPPPRKKPEYCDKCKQRIPTWSEDDDCEEQHLKCLYIDALGLNKILELVKSQKIQVLYRWWNINDKYEKSPKDIKSYGFNRACSNPYAN